MAFLTTMTNILLLALAPLITAIPLSNPENPSIPTPILGRAESPSTSALTASLSATPRAGTGEYISPITIGGQTFNVLLDTGSSDLWVKGDAAKQLTNVESTDGTFDIHYGSGSVTGNIYTGPVSVGGLTLSSLAFGVAKEPVVPAYDDYDGILGIASSATQFTGGAKTDSWIAKLAPLLAEPVLAFDLANEIVQIGYTQPPSGSGDLNYVSVDPASAHWDVTVKSGGGQATCDLDTGTTRMEVPRELVADYWSQVEGAKEYGSYYSYPCDAKLPELKFEIGGVEYAVPASSIQIGKDGDTCTGQPKVVGSDDGCILGQGFLKNIYVVYDYGNKTVGLSQGK